jgi:NAD(P)-dependent dehydrogenase (short-subunit alcohol dehydrogenase family)
LEGLALNRRVSGGGHNRLASRLRLIPRPFSSGSQAIGADLADLEKLESVVIATEQALAGHVDILFNSAAVFEYDTLKSVSASSLRRHLEVNVTAAVLLTRFATRHTSRNEPGLILNILDCKIHNPFPDFLSYTLTKYAMHGFTQVAVWELAPHWRVCAIAPGYTLAGPEQSPEHFARTHDSVPLKRGQLRRISGRPLCI